MLDSISNMSTTSMVTIAAVLGGIAAGWSKIKEFLVALKGIFIVTITVRSENLQDFRMVQKAVTNNFVIRPLNNFKYLAKTARATNNIEESLILNSNYSGYKGFCTAKNIPMYIKIDRDYYWFPEVKVVYLRGTFNKEKFLNEIFLNQCDNNKVNSSQISNNTTSEFFIRHMWGTITKTGMAAFADAITTDKKSSDTSSEKEIDQFSTNVSESLNSGMVKVEYGNPNAFKKHNNKVEDPYVSKVFLSTETSKLLEELKIFIESKDWYLKHGISYKRGLGLYGIPGTGKSATVFAIAKKLDIPIKVFHLESMTNEDFVKAWTQNKTKNVCIHLLEDLDNVFDGRENKNKTDNAIGVTFDCLLNVIDGVDICDGIITVITTNFIDKLDPALIGVGKSGRPGRIDTCIEMSYIEETGIRYIMNHILSDATAEQREQIYVDNFKSDKLTASKVADICTKEALKIHWQAKQKGNLI